MNKRRRNFLLAILGALAAFGIFLGGRYFSDWVAKNRRELEAALPAGRGVFDSLGLPDGARPYEERQERIYRRKGQRVEISQTFECPGRFADVVAWYQARLGAQGWKPWDVQGWRDFRADFCKAPWLLDLEQDVSYEDQRPPHHRFRLRLQWSRGFTGDRCPYPD